MKILWFIFIFGQSWHPNQIQISNFSIIFVDNSILELQFMKFLWFIFIFWSFLAPKSNSNFEFFDQICENSIFELQFMKILWFIFIFWSFLTPKSNSNFEFFDQICKIFDIWTSIYEDSMVYFHILYNFGPQIKFKFRIFR